MKSTLLTLSAVVVLSGFAFSVWSALTIPIVQVGVYSKEIVSVTDYKGNEMPKEYPEGRYDLVVVADPVE